MRSLRKKLCFAAVVAVKGHLCITWAPFSEAGYSLPVAQLMSVNKLSRAPAEIGAEACLVSCIITQEQPSLASTA